MADSFRLVAQGKQQEDCELLSSGAVVMAQHSQFHLCTELVLLLLTVEQPSAQSIGVSSAVLLVV